MWILHYYSMKKRSLFLVKKIEKLISNCYSYDLTFISISLINLAINKILYYQIRIENKVGKKLP